MSAWGPLDNLLRAYGDLQARLQTAEADLAAAREREQRLVAALASAEIRETELLFAVCTMQGDVNASGFALRKAGEREQRLVDALMTPMTDDEDGSAECLSDCEDGDCLDPDAHYGFICLFLGCAGPVLNATDSRHASDCPVLMSAIAAAAPSAVAQEPRGEGV